MKTLSVQIRNVEDVVTRITIAKATPAKKRYKIAPQYQARFTEMSAALKVAKFEDTFIYSQKGDLLLALYRLMDTYVDKPSKDTKHALSNFIQANWKKLPVEVKTKGHAYRIWIFNKVYTKQAISKLVKNQPLNVKSAEFLSFTSKIPTGAGVFKKYWSVFKNNVTEDGSLVLIQRQEYKNGFGVTDYMQYLLTKGYIVDEGDVNESNRKMDYESMDPESIALMNEEQEIFVFDDVLEILAKDVISIKVTVSKNDKKYEGIVIPKAGVKFVDVGSFDEARKLLRDLGVHV